MRINDVMDENELDRRSREVLKAIVQSYITSAEPVGSKTVTEKFNFGLCPATIRNIMADLEGSGYLTQPHTSAGRIPTDRGYRFYVNSMRLESEKSPESSYRNSLFEEFNSRLEVKKDLSDLMQETSRVLSFMSRQLGVVLAPRLSETTFRKIEFIKHKGKRIFVIFITEEGIVQSRLIEYEEELTQKDLSRIAEFLNRRLKGLTLKDVKERIMEEIKNEKAYLNKIVEKAIGLYLKIIEFELGGDLYIGGMAEVFNLPDFSDISKIKRIVRTIEDKNLIINLLDRAMESEGIQVFIGSENPCLEMSDCSMVTSTYREGGRVIGTLGIIGPKRMNYSEVISIVGCTAKLLSRVLTEG